MPEHDRPDPVGQEREQEALRSEALRSEALRSEALRSAALGPISRRTALTGTAAGMAAVLLAACGGGGPADTASAGTTSAGTGSETGTGAATSTTAGVFGPAEPYRFTLVSHATNDSFFVPTQNGAADACKLLGCSYQWTGSQTGNIPQMITAINNAVSQKVDGIATTLTDHSAFNSPVADALSAGIPVIAYNADVAGNPRLAYIGQNLYLSGVVIAQRIVSLLPGGGDIAVFASTPGTPNVQPRIEGVNRVLKRHHHLRHRVVASGATESEQLTTVESFVSAHPTYSGFFGADAGSTAAVAQAISKYNLRARHVVGGGCDLNPLTQQLLASGQIQFTTDQQPYLQGFLAILELYLYNVSAKLTGIADVDTGLKVVNRSNIGAYAATKSRYEGTSTSAGVQKS